MESIVEIGKRYKSDKGTVHSYLEVYDVLFDRLRSSAINLVEIGVDKGESLKLWREVFSSGSICGIDHNHDTLGVPGCDVMIMSATDDKRISSNWSDNSIDILIDDGSHKATDQLLSWCYFWPKIRAGGIYVVEDVTALNMVYFKGHGFLVLDRRHLKDQQDDILAIKVK